MRYEFSLWTVRTDASHTAVSYMGREGYLVQLLHFGCLRMVLGFEQHGLSSCNWFCFMFSANGSLIRV